jgi:hemoglobin-like flavoprotein
MSEDSAVITQTLERVAERVGDPTPYVFRRLFEDRPEIEGLFIADTGGLVRGQMLQTTIDSLLDFVGDRSYGSSLVQIERVNHQGLGVDPAIFDTFYHVIMATFRDILGADWTTEMEVTWTRIIAELTTPPA